MAVIDINIGEVSNINAQLPRHTVTLSSVRRELEILRWRLDEELMNHNYMKERYGNILREISKVEEKINDVHNFISSAIMQYEELERLSKNQIDVFL